MIYILFFPIFFILQIFPFSSITIKKSYAFFICNVFHELARAEKYLFCNVTLFVSFGQNFFFRVERKEIACLLTCGEVLCFFISKSVSLFSFVRFSSC